MENRNVGYLLLGVSAIIIIIILMFNSALSEIINSSCTMAGHESCTMDDALNKQTNLTLVIAGILVLVSLFLIFSKQSEKIVVKTVKEKRKEKVFDLAGFREEERKVFNLIKENKTIFQADLIEKTGFGKAKMSRIIDRLEGKGYVERKRRGMTNVVVLKED
jgi:uncharacterized membrane protein